MPIHKTHLTSRMLTTFLALSITTGVNAETAEDK